MKREALTPEIADRLVSELRMMAMLPPGSDDANLRRAKEICYQLNGLPTEARSVPAASARAYSELEVLLSARRWKTEPPSIEALRKTIKSACDRLRVAVEAAFHVQKG